MTSNDTVLLQPGADTTHSPGSWIDSSGRCWWVQGRSDSVGAFGVSWTSPHCSSPQFSVCDSGSWRLHILEESLEQATKEGFKNSFPLTDTQWQLRHKELSRSEFWVLIWVKAASSGSGLCPADRRCRDVPASRLPSFILRQPQIVRHRAGQPEICSPSLALLEQTRPALLSLQPQNDGETSQNCSVTHWRCKCWGYLSSFFISSVAVWMFSCFFLIFFFCFYVFLLLLLRFLASWFNKHQLEVVQILTVLIISLVFLSSFFLRFCFFRLLFLSANKLRPLPLLCTNQLLSLSYYNHSVNL